jgi:endoglucanase
VRDTGANNVVIIGGLNYAYDLSGIANYAIDGVNIMYNTHPYDFGGKQVFYKNSHD